MTATAGPPLDARFTLNSEHAMCIASRHAPRPSAWSGTEGARATHPKRHAHGRGGSHAHSRRDRLPGLSTRRGFQYRLRAETHPGRADGPCRRDVPYARRAPSPADPGRVPPPGGVGLGVPRLREPIVAIDHRGHPALRAGNNARLLPPGASRERERGPCACHRSRDPGADRGALVRHATRGSARELPSPLIKRYRTVELGALPSRGRLLARALGLALLGPRLVRRRRRDPLRDLVRAPARRLAPLDVLVLALALRAFHSAWWQGAPPRISYLFLTAPAKSGPRSRFIGTLGSCGRASSRCCCFR